MLEVTGLNTFEGFKYEDIELEEIVNPENQLELFSMQE